MSTSHFELIGTTGEAELYWDGAVIWAGPLPVLKELRVMIDALDYRVRLDPGMRLRLTVEASNEPL